MKRTLILSLSALLLASSMTACGNGTAKETDMEEIDLVCMRIAELVPLCATIFSFIYGIRNFFKKGKPNFFRRYGQMLQTVLRCLMRGAKSWTKINTLLKIH